MFEQQTRICDKKYTVISQAILVIKILMPHRGTGIKQSPADLEEFKLGCRT